jgi:hypothetical protein
MNKPSIAWSEFSKKKDSWKFIGNESDLIHLVEDNWSRRKSGVGRKDLTQVIVVPIKEIIYFLCDWLPIECAKRITGKVIRRQDHEDSFVSLKGNSRHSNEVLSVLHVNIILYSAATLLENDGTRSSNADWEIVAILTGPWKDEPMMPLTMARNFLQKPGGTYAPYTAEQFAQSIYFWSQYIQKR